MNDRLHAPYRLRLCGRRIGGDWIHFMTEALSRPLCARCISRPDAHRRLYPRCPEHGHDAFDHRLHPATRAAAHRLMADRPIAGYEGYGINRVGDVLSCRPQRIRERHLRQFRHPTQAYGR
jgi:hypothetical protein